MQGPARLYGSNAAATAPLDVSVRTSMDGGAPTNNAVYIPFDATQSSYTAGWTLAQGLSFSCPSNNCNEGWDVFCSANGFTASAVLNDPSLPSFRLQSVSDAYLKANFLIGPRNIRASPITAFSDLQISVVLAGNTLTYTRPVGFTGSGTVTTFQAD